MSFRVAARMVLELGAELISSDAIALYELLKNSIDAGSSSVAVKIQVVLKKSHLLEATQAIDADASPADVRKRLLANIEPDAPPDAARAFRDAIRDAGDNAQGLSLILKKAYHEHNWIRVQDSGHGMTAQELKDVFLTIGTPSRRRAKTVGSRDTATPTPILLGDKGVGRLSAMRLGDRMTVTTSRSGERHQNVLDIDWDSFSHDSAAMIDEVLISPQRGEAKARQRDCGTTITVRGLRSDWDRGRFTTMIKEQFKRIIDPFPNSRSAATRRDPNELFHLEFNATRTRIPQIPKWLLDAAHAVVTARYDDVSPRGPVLSGEVDYRLRGRETQFECTEHELMSITDPILNREIRTGPQTLRKLGPFSVRFYWYNRRLLKELPGIGKRGDILKEVNSWAGGLMVFRDCFRINPYGGQDDDWLELDKKAFAAKAYKVNRSQLIGQVSLSSQNFGFVEQTNREGFVDNGYKQILVAILRHILISEFRRFIEQVDKNRRMSDDSTTDDLEHRIDETTVKIDTGIREMKRRLPREAAALSKLERLFANLRRTVEQAKAVAKEYEDDRSKFVHLAGVGLMVEFILHEIGRTTSRALDAVGAIDTSRLERAGAAGIDTLKDQLVTLSKRVDSLDPLSTPRRQVKERFDVAELVKQVIDGRAAQFRRHGIDVTCDLPKQHTIRAVKGMLLQILENLFENSVYWLKIQHRRDRNFSPGIAVRLDPVAREITVKDNGPGVRAQRAQQIFEPFVTSKPPGQGRGLGLYISREMARYHDWELLLHTADLDGDGRSATFVLEMGGHGER